MPGFVITNGDPKKAKLHKSEYRRKHRWRVTTLENGPVTAQDWLQLKSCSRPNFTLQEAEVHHDQEVAYFAGKQTWEPIEFTFYDSVGGNKGGGNDISAILYDWVNVVSDIPRANVALPSVYKKTLKLVSTNQNGDADEEWTLHGCWPSKTNWNDLDYSNNEIQLVAVTVRYDRAEKSS